MNIDIDELIERYKTPINKGIIKESCCAQSNNYSCGDNIRICIEIDNGIIKSARFDGDGCVLSQTTADKICDYLIFKSVDEIKRLDYNKIKEIIGFEPTIQRVKCVMIASDALKNIKLDA